LAFLPKASVERGAWGERIVAGEEGVAREEWRGKMSLFGEGLPTPPFGRP